jgi:hypothetical protein
LESSAKFLIFVACGLYVWVVYPIIPQSYGGGEPMNVQLLVDADKLPSGEPEPGHPIRGGDNSDAKHSKAGIVTIPVTLYYETQDAYYFSKNRGPIMSLAHDAVEGVIYSPKAPQTELPVPGVSKSLKFTTAPKHDHPKVR